MGQCGRDHSLLFRDYLGPYGKLGQASNVHYIKFPKHSLQACGSGKEAVGQE